MVDGKYPIKTFNSDEDVLEIIGLLEKETTQLIEEGKDFDVATAVSSQLPFFGCNNIVLKNEYQKDISKYLYCKEFGIPPHKGEYGEQPYKWVQKYQIIKNALSKREEIMIKRARETNG